jgi:hypothetical protein
VSSELTLSLNPIKAHLKISTTSFFLYSFISVISVPLALSKQLSWKNFLIFCYMGVTITALVGIFIYISNLSTKGYQKSLDSKQQRIFTLSLVALAGVLRGFLLYLSTDLGGFEQPTSLVARLISSTATTLFWLTLFSIAVEDARVFKDRYESLLRTSILRIAQAGISKESTQFSPELQEEISEIESLLSNTFDEATRSAMDHTTMMLAAMSVRKTNEENIRPLSHRLWLRISSS